MQAAKTTEAALSRHLAPHIAAAGGAAGEHPEAEIILAHAANELAPDEALAVTRHLAACHDGRCVAVLRDVVAGAAVARAALFGRAEETTDSGVDGPQRQRARAFECPDALWQAFVELAEEAGASVDWLVNDAMKAYAQQRSGPIAPRHVTVKDALHDPPRERNTPTLQRSYLPRAPASARRALQQPARGDHDPGSSQRAAHLSVVMEGVEYEVTKERFVVGRGGRASDLAIDDPGVSRQHALIEHAGGSYWLVDMGSTNGVEFEGQRIARKRIDHGDRFRIGDHELEFVFS
jgi:hypothetical protein